MAGAKVHALIEYEDSYVQPLLVAALQHRLSPDLLTLVHEASKVLAAATQLFQWRQYESIDFDRLIRAPASNLANSYVIRKALIRKHYLSTTVSHWCTKHPQSILGKHVKPSVEFEVDYAEFLDDALVEAYELKESWARNEALTPDEQMEWWILKPGMSERGQGIRLFSSEAELQQIFEEWDPPSDDEEEDALSSNGAAEHSANGEQRTSNGVVTSHLRHFVAQPYIDRPLLLAEPHVSAGRKFHIRAYVLAVGAMKVYVYRPMLALFAEKLYTAPSVSTNPNEHLSTHLTNTCLQSGEREGSVHDFWSLPTKIASTSTEDWQEDVCRQICSITGEVFEAAARSMSIHFQPLPNAFEIFGLDFLVDASGTAWLLEVNAFPDFAQTGEELQHIIRDLFADVVSVAVRPFFQPDMPAQDHEMQMLEVLNIDLGRR